MMANFVLGLRECICVSNCQSIIKTNTEVINILNKLGYDIRINKEISYGYSVIFISCVILLVTKLRFSLKIQNMSRKQSLSNRSENLCTVRE